MDIRIIALAGIVALSSAVKASAQNWHPGSVVDRESNASIDAEVSAWSPTTGQVTEATPCPMLEGDLVDSTISNQDDGKFEVKIPSDQSLYSVVYCRNDYQPAIMKHLRNGPPGSPTSPLPMRLQMVSSDTAAIDATNLAIFALNQLAYLRSVNPEGFDSAMNEYAGQIAEIDGAASEAFFGLSSVVSNWMSDF